jgi:hypothetical protein
MLRFRYPGIPVGIALLSLLLIPATANQARPSDPISIKHEIQPDGNVYLWPQNSGELYYAAAYRTSNPAVKTIFLKSKVYLLPKSLRLTGDTNLYCEGSGCVLKRNFFNSEPTLAVINDSISEVGHVEERMRWDNTAGPPKEATYRVKAQLNEPLTVGQMVIIEGAGKPGKYLPGMFNINIYIGKDENQNLLFEYLPSFKYAPNDIIYIIEPIRVNLKNVVVDSTPVTGVIKGKSGYKYTHAKQKKYIGSNGIGIDYRGVINGTISNVTVKNHFIGIHLYDSHRIEISSSHLERNRNGIQVNRTSLLDIINSRVIDSYRTGIFITKAYNVKILGNTIESTALRQGGGGDSISAYTTTNLMISNNMISRSGCFGMWIMFNTQNVLVSDNIVTSGVTGACQVDSPNPGAKTFSNAFLITNNIFTTNPWPFKKQGHSYDIMYKENIENDKYSYEHDRFREYYRQFIMWWDNFTEKKK